MGGDDIGQTGTQGPHQGAWTSHLTVSLYKKVRSIVTTDLKGVTVFVSDEANEAR